MLITFDTNVLLDVLVPNLAFCDNSMRAINLASKGHNSAYISASSITDMFYILRRHGKDKSTIKNAIKEILSMVTVSAVDEQCIIAALDGDWRDFEDEVQHNVALQMRSDCMVTRNTGDFAASLIPVYSPEDFIRLYDTQ